MKILMPVLHYYPVIGGLETWTQNVAERLSDKAEIFVVTGMVEDMKKEEKFLGVKIFRTSFTPLRDLSYSSLFYILTALPFIFLKSVFLVQKEKIDFCHCQGFLSSFLGYLIFKIKKIPYIVTVQKLEYKKDFLRKLVYKNARICIVPSLAVKEYFKEIKVKDVRVIPNGIDFEMFENLDRMNLRKKSGFEDEFIIIAVGRLERRKGFRYLIQAMQILKGKIGKIKLLIAGGGELKESLERLRKDLFLEKEIDFLGQIPREEIPGYLAIADCFVLPSLEEGFGIVILEAMASDLAVVGTKIGGILDIIKDGENGLLVESKNPAKIAEAVFKLYSDKEFAMRLSQRAGADLGKYEWNSIVERVYKIYQELL